MKLIFNYSDISVPVLLETNMKEQLIEGKPNTQLELRCLVKGRSKPVITWYKNNQQFKVNKINRTKLEDDNQRLIFTRLLDTDSGLYECEASNIGGKLKRSARLKVDRLQYMTNGFSIEEVVVIILFVVVGTVMIITAFYVRKKIRKERVSSILLFYFY